MARHAGVRWRRRAFRAVPGDRLAPDDLAQFNRRLHLYLGLALLPWFFMSGISSIPFAHNQFFERRDAAKGLPLWTLRSTHAVDAAIPEDPSRLRAFGATLLQRAGIIASTFGAYRQSPTQVNVYVYSFWKSTQLKYFADQKRLPVEDRRFRWDHFLTGMHARSDSSRKACSSDPGASRRSGLPRDRPVDYFWVSICGGDAGIATLGLAGNRGGGDGVRGVHVGL